MTATDIDIDSTIHISTLEHRSVNLQIVRTEPFGNPPKYHYAPHTYEMGEDSAHHRDVLYSTAVVDPTTDKLYIRDVINTIQDGNIKEELKFTEITKEQLFQELAANGIHAASHDEEAVYGYPLDYLKERNVFPSTIPLPVIPNIIIGEPEEVISVSNRVVGIMHSVQLVNA